MVLPRQIYRFARGMRLGFVGLLCAATTSWADENWGGLITDLAVIGDDIYGVSGDVFWQATNPKPTRIQRLDFRLFGMASMPADATRPTRVALVGGEPGVSGIFAWASVSAREGPISQTIAEDLIYDVAISPDAKTLALACADGRILVGVMPNDGFPEWRTRFRHTAAARAVAFSPDGRMLASAGLDGLVLLGTVDGQKEPRALQDHTDKVECVAFTADSQAVYSGARDGKVRVHAVDGRLLRTYRRLGGERSVTARSVWEEQDSILSLIRLPDAGTLLAGTSKGSIYHLSPTNTDSGYVQSVGAPINALVYSNGVWVGGRGVTRLTAAFPLRER